MTSLSKSDALYLRIRNEILSLGLAPGHALRLPILSEQFGVGVTPLRECFNRLSAERLVVVEHNKGFRVAPISLNDLLDLEASRSAIEGALFTQSIEQGDEEWERRVIGAYHHLAALPPISVLQTDVELGVWKDRHSAFHSALISGVRAQWMAHFQKQISDNLERYHLHIQRSLHDYCARNPNHGDGIVEIYAKALSIEPHTDLFNCAMSRSLDSARGLFEAHVNITVEAFVALGDIVEYGMKPKVAAQRSGGKIT